MIPEENEREEPIGISESHGVVKLEGDRPASSVLGSSKAISPQPADGRASPVPALAVQAVLVAEMRVLAREMGGLAQAQERMETQMMAQREEQSRMVTQLTDLVAVVGQFAQSLDQFASPSWSPNVGDPDSPAATAGP